MALSSWQMLCCAVKPFRLSLCLSGSTGQATAQEHKYMCLSVYVHVGERGADCELLKQK